MNDVSTALDSITQVVGYTLVRGVDFWEGALYTPGGGGGSPWVPDNLCQTANTTSYGDPYATEGTMVDVAADVSVAGLYATCIFRNASSQRAVIWEIDATTGNFVADIAASPIRTAAWQKTGINYFAFTDPVDLEAGKRYFFGAQRTDGIGTTNVGLHYYNGSNSYQTDALVLIGLQQWALTGVPAAAQAPTNQIVTKTVWSIGAMIQL